MPVVENAAADDDDPNDSSFVDEISRISLDDYTYDTFTVGYNTAVPGLRQKHEHVDRGDTKLGLVYSIYKWHDSFARSRTSI